MKTMMQFFSFIFTTTAIQLAGTLGIFFVFGIILSFLQRRTHQIYRQTIGWRGILWTAWIGTPIHEFGHILFVKLFRHKILRISIFAPNEETGGLGSVDHSYSRRSVYQRIGNFFVGAAPLIFGSAFLTLLLYILVPNGKEIFSPLRNLDSFQTVLQSLTQTLLHLFSRENISSWNFWLFLYISFCIATHMAPSQRDLRSMWGGFVWIVLPLVFVNIIAYLAGRDVTDYILRLNHLLGALFGMYIYAILLGLLHLIGSFVILSPFRQRV